MKAWKRTKRLNSLVPFSLNDEPTARHPPTEAEAEAERASLRRDAALGAGTPGYLTKQEQLRPTCTENCLSTGSSSSSSDKAALQGSRVSGEEAGASEPRRTELGGIHNHSYGINASGYGDERSSPKHTDSSQSELLGEALTKPSDHEQGLWVGFLSIFRFEKKRASITGGAASALLNGPVLGESRDLPNHDLLFTITGPSDETILSSHIADGRRGSRKQQVLLPPGPANINETASHVHVHAHAHVHVECATPQVCVRAGTNGACASCLCMTLCRVSLLLTSTRTSAAGLERRVRLDR